MRIILEVGTQIYQPKGLPWKSREGTENNRWSEVCANKKRKTWRADNKNKGCVRISGPSTEERPVKRDRMFAGCVFLLFCFIICLLGPRRAYIFVVSFLFFFCLVIFGLVILVIVSQLPFYWDSPIFWCFTKLKNKCQFLYKRADKHATPRCESSELLIGATCSGGTPRTP